ncbi:MAG: hypothetical protein AAF602_05505 [Myxococcota bacterium]
MHWWLPLVLGCGPKRVQDATTLSFAVPTGDEATFDIAGAEGEWAPGPDARTLPLSAWVQVGETVAYTYVDPQQGASAQWRSEGVLHVRRVPLEPAGLVVLRDERRRELGLPDVPAWIEAYGPQPLPGTRWGGWRTDPRLAGRFHPDYPDDVQVLVGGGGLPFEGVWMSLRQCDDTGCTGALLNQPTKVPLSLGQPIRFRFADIGEAGLIAATTPDAEVPEDLVAAAQAFGATPEQMWDPDPQATAEERLLVPVFLWSRIGDALVYTHADMDGLQATWLNPRGQVQTQHIDVRPAGMQPLSSAEIEALELNPNPLGLQPPPEPFLYGEWRVDEVLGPLLGQSGDPDTLWVRPMFRTDGDTTPGQRLADELPSRARVIIRFCDEARCTGLLLDDLGVDGVERGAVARFDRSELWEGLPIAVIERASP